MGRAPIRRSFRELLLLWPQQQQQQRDGRANRIQSVSAETKISNTRPEQQQQQQQEKKVEHR